MAVAGDSRCTFRPCWRPCISPRSNTTRKTIGCEPSRFVRDVDLHPVPALLPGVGALTLDSRVDICLYNVIVIRMSDRKSELRGRAMPSESERVTIRLPPDKVKALHQLVKGGTFTTISDAIRAAIDRFIDIQFAPDYIRRLMIELPKGNVVDLQQLVKSGDSVHRLHRIGIHGARTVVVNTDAVHLDSIQADRKILIGGGVTRGMGAGGRPDVGERCAELAEQELRNQIGDSDLTFITVGLGGGTGTGIAPFLAELAQAAGSVVIALATTPFRAERGRMNNARAGLQHLP